MLSEKSLNLVNQTTAPISTWKSRHSSENVRGEINTSDKTWIHYSHI